MVTTLFFLSGCSFTDSKEDVDFHTSKTREESEYCKEILDEVIRCLDEDDTETLYNLFSEYAKSKHTLEREIKKAMEAYDGKSVSCDEYAYGRGSYSVYYGYYSFKIGESEYGNVSMDTGEEYKLIVEICLVNDDEPEYMGLSRIRIKDANFRCDFEHNDSTLATIGY